MLCCPVLWNENKEWCTVLRLFSKFDKMDNLMNALIYPSLWIYKGSEVWMALRSVRTCARTELSSNLVRCKCKSELTVSCQRHCTETPAFHLLARHGRIIRQFKAPFPLSPCCIDVSLQISFFHVVSSKCLSKRPHAIFYFFYFFSFPSMSPETKWNPGKLGS